MMMDMTEKISSINLIDGAEATAVIAVAATVTMRLTKIIYKTSNRSICTTRTMMHAKVRQLSITIFATSNGYRAMRNHRSMKIGQQNHAPN